jgi:uncharacterized damage-inducible protein DinB
MAQSDPVTILLDTSVWATGLIIETCKPLSRDQFHRRFEMGPGSLHDTITHTIGAIRSWTDSLRGGERRPWLGDQGPFTIDQLRSLLAESDTDFRAAALSGPLDEPITIHRRDGKVLTLTRAAIITHVGTHGMYHLAQCQNMLRNVGVDPLPASSVVQWAITIDDPEAMKS